MGLARRAIGPALLVLGALLIGDAVRTGGASFALLLILPVFTGSSPTFAAGVLALIVGVFLLPLAFGEVDTPENPRQTPGTAPTPAPPAESGSGGVLLIGPIPIFWGSWGRPSPRTYRRAVLFGVLALAVAIVFAVWLVR